MKPTLTAVHACVMFNAIVKARFGRHWREDVSPQVLLALGEELALGFGGTLCEELPEAQITAPRGESHGLQSLTHWRFPDASVLEIDLYRARLSLKTRDAVPFRLNTPGKRTRAA